MTPSAERHSDNESPRSKWLAVQAGRSIRLVDTADIDWIKAAGHYVRVHCDSATYLLRRSLADLEKELDGRFIRLNRSTLVRIDHIDYVHPTDNGRFEVAFRCGMRVRMSPTGRARLRKIFGL